MNAVNIQTPFSSFTISIDHSTNVEDLIIEACKFLEIGPFARHLFALRESSSPIWLCLNANVQQTLRKDFKLLIRFNVPDVNRLYRIDAKAYDFYFKQVKREVLHDELPASVYKLFKSEVIGLCAIDMFRAIVEEGLNKKDVIKNYRKYIPWTVYKQHFFFLKNPMAKTVDTISQNQIIHDAFYLKSGYLEQFKKIFPNYLSETFIAKITNGIKPGDVEITVDPYSIVYPGISMKYVHKKEEMKRIHVCTIEELCCLSICEEGTVEISRRNGIPLYIRFNSIPQTMSFVSLLDGYYRLSVKWIFNLCHDVTTPSLQKLLSMKCHGPISDEFAHRKLQEKRNYKVGCFVLRECSQKYDTYFIDVCKKPGTKPDTHKIETTTDKKYKVYKSKRTYTSISEFVAENKSVFRECLPPSEFDQSDLLICQTKKNQPEEVLNIKPLCIDTRTLMVFRGKPPEVGKNQFTNVYRALWSSGKDKKEVALKVLKESCVNDYLNKFFSITDHWIFDDYNSFIKLYGVTLQNPTAMVMEYLPLGRLDLYLKNANSHVPVEEVDLVEAATYLANALWYLEEVSSTHGNIRCRKVLVFAHSKNSFVVKLSYPGLCDSYTDEDLHWIPPEYHNDTINDARKSIAADVWAFGTTLWEMFSSGNTPTLTEGTSIKEFYKSGKTLPKPQKCPAAVFHLMTECWTKETDFRKRPQAVMRDMNQVLYQVHHARLDHFYTPIMLSPDNQQDAVFCNQKEDVDFPALTIHTVDETKKSSSEIPDVLKQTLCSPRLEYQRIENVSSLPPSTSNQVDCNFEDNAISSLRSIFELDQEWKLLLNGGRIGEGFYGEVFKGTLQRWYSEEDSQTVAVKKLKLNMLTRDKLADFDREISIMKKLHHPNIVKIKGIIRDPQLCMVLEYIENGSLLSYLKIHHNRLDSFRLLKFALEVANGMAYLGKQKIVHRDLAARNILVVNDSYVKISDFGLAQFIGNEDYYRFKTVRKLPLPWYAPESIEFGKFSPQSDVWSYGVTLFEIFSYGENPKLPESEGDVDRILNALKKGIRFPCPTDCPNLVYSKIMKQCWQYEPKKRLDFRIICKLIGDLSSFHST